MIRTLRVGLGVLVLLLGGCAEKNDDAGEQAPASGFNAGLTAVVHPSEAAGGTLHLATANDVDSWDPTRSYINAVYNLQRLYVRTLLTPAAAPGTTELVPDLAAGPPDVSGDGLTYTFRLRDGNADQPTTGFVQYAAMSTKMAPFDNVHCRRAVQYAVDKSAVQTARGAGQIAGGMLPPGIPGYD